MHQRSFFTQSDELNPFFITMLGDRSAETQNIRSTVQNTYKLYRPTADENPQFVDLKPPAEDQHEQNYYVIEKGEKPRKNKKYSEKDESVKKYKKFENLKEKIVQDEGEVQDHEAEPTENDYEESDYSQSSAEIEETAALTNESEEKVEARRASAEDEPRRASSEDEPSEPSTRLDFQMHGN